MAYTALGTYNDAEVSDQDKQKIQALKDQYAKASAAGDTAGMASAHQYAESLRSQYGYSGGGDGSEYIPLQNGQPTKTTTRAATSQSDYINQLYAAKQANALAGLKAAYDQNMADVNAAQAKIPATYNAARNQSAATSEQNRANFNELAAARGINSGTGSQAALAQNIALQNNMTNLNNQEAQANTDIETQRLKLSIAYNNAIQQAISENDYQKAQALYNEGVRVDNSLVEQSRQQAALDYQYQQAVAAQKQQQFENDMATNNAQMQAAFARAEYGDFSALKSMYGWDDATAQQALYVWKLKNGLITNFNSGSGGGRSSGRSSSGGGSGNSGAAGTTGANLFGGAPAGSPNPLNQPTVDSASNISSLEYQLSKIEDSKSGVQSKAANIIKQYLNSGAISEATAKKYLSQYGL